MDDNSDILGQQTYPKLKDDLPSRSPLSFTTGAFLLAGLLALYLLGMWIWEKVLIWREKAYKLSMRRRYGIPDTDHRPFNVAYADVVQARRNNEATKKRPAPAASTDRVAAPAEQTIRQRPSSTPYVPGAYSSFSASGVSAEPNSSRFAAYGQPSSASDRYSLGASAAPINLVTYETSPKRSGPTRRFTRKNLDANGDIDVRKRTLDEQEDDDEDVEHGWKKTKVEGDEFIDGDEDAEWENEQNGYVPVRGSKRGLGEEDEIEVSQSERSRDKRARKVSLEKTPQTFVFDDMDVDEDEAADEVPDLRESSSRGKKRDRAEAGSTFGDEEDTPEHDEEDAKSRRRRRKRRTVSNGKRKSDAASNSRGKKRDRDIEDSGSDMENEENIALKSSRKKRGKRGSLAASRLDEDSRSDDESLGSSRSRGRRIGDEWEVNGIRWKIGPNGQRLRQALVKKARQKFVMPKDSQHPDRQANLEVYVETWLTEEEYEDAKSQHLLAWQDSPKASTEPENLSVNTQLPQSPQTATGKNLLWNTVTPAGSPMGISPVQPPVGIPTGRQIAARDLSNTVRANPFNTPQKVAAKRITATLGTPRGGLNDSTNGSPRVYKVYSKWEKQELEARAMNKIREAERAKEQKAQQEQLERERALRERLEKEKAEKEAKDREAATAAAAAAAAKPPAITLTPANSKPATAEPAKPSPFSFGKPAEAEQPKAPGTADPSKPSLFNAPPLGSTPFAAPAEGSAKPADKPATPSFSFPASTPAAPTATTIPSTMPNFFKPVPTPAQPTATQAPAASPFGQPPAASGETRKSPFSFGPAPTAAAPTTAPASGTATKSPFSFGATTQPAENKNNSLLSRIAPPSSSNASAEQPKPSPFGPPSSSPFSFSKTDAAKPASPFGAPSSTAQTPAPSAPAAPPSAPPKFDFGIKPAATATPAASSSSLSGALTPKPTPSAAEANKFSFTNIKPAHTTESKDAFSATSPATVQPPAAPKFSFGATGAFGAKPAAETKEAAKSPFSFTPSTTTTTTTATETKEAPKPAFTFGPSTTTTTPTTTATPSAFGSTSFAGFGTSSKPADKPSPFAFAAPSSTSAAPATTETPKSGFTFGATTTPSSSSPFGAPPTPTAAGAAPTTFKFGETKPPATTTPFGTPGTGTSMFGGSSAGLSAFGFGTPGTNTTSAFGAGGGQE